MLVIHHLEKSQSERIIWLCEELGLPCEIRHYKRDPVTILAPPALRAVHPMGAAPVIEDGGVVLAESGAIVEYILARHGAGTLAPAADAANFPDYLYWFHFANGNLQPVMGRSLVLSRLKLPTDNPVLAGQQGRLDRALGLVDTRLGQADYLAGDALTAADIMTVFSLTTMRIFFPVDFTPYANIRHYLQRIGGRPAYRRAMQKGDPDLTPLLD